MLFLLRKTVLWLALALVAFTIYACVVNRNNADMSIRQKFIRAAYPIFMRLSKNSRGYGRELSHDPLTPPVSFYTLKATLNDGRTLDFSDFKGAYVLLVNTASDCGFTPQYEALQQLSLRQQGRLMVIGFPSNDFKQQERGSDDAIAAFCKKNYGVTFPIVVKSQVISGNEQHPVFRWLTQPSLNGWNATMPAWNFSKYLIDGEGRLIHYFGPSVDPGRVEEFLK